MNGERGGVPELVSHLSKYRRLEEFLRKHGISYQILHIYFCISFKTGGGDLANITKIPTSLFPIIGFCKRFALVLLYFILFSFIS